MFVNISQHKNFVSIDFKSMYEEQHKEQPIVLKEKRLKGFPKIIKHQSIVFL